MLKLAGSGAIEGRIEWLHPERGAAIQFESPIGVALFKKILARHPAQQLKPANLNTESRSAQTAHSSAPHRPIIGIIP